ncbi:MAG: TnpV protein [Lawsonibacter sp.]|nr:TnpV protein [Lawsonibacter sp.]
MELNYRRSGEYRLPNLLLEESGETYGKYGMLRKSYLQEHRKGTYISLLTQGKLTAYLAGIDRTARMQIEQTVEAMKAGAGVTEELKAKDPMEWTGRMNTLKHQAEDAIYQELIYK